MPIDPVLGTAGLTLLQSLFDKGDGGQKDYTNQAKSNMGQMQDIINMFLPTAEADLGRYNSTMGGLDPVRMRQIMMLQSLMGIAPGTKYTTPVTANPSIPSYLRSALSGPEGSAKRRAAEVALEHGASQAAWEDMQKDVGYSQDWGRWSARLKRAFGTDQVTRGSSRGTKKGREGTEGFQVPGATIGGDTYEVPGMDTLPDYLNPARPKSLTLDDVITPERRAAIIGVGDWDATETARKSREAAMMSLAGRGLTGMGTTGTQDVGAEIGTRNLLNSIRTEKQGELAGMEMDLLPQLTATENANEANWRAEKSAAIQQLLSSIFSQGQALKPDMAPFLGGVGQVAGMNMDMANQAGAQNAQAARNYGDLAGSIMGYYANKQPKAKKATASVVTPNVTNNVVAPSQGIKLGQPWTPAGVYQKNPLVQPFDPSLMVNW